MWARGEGKMDYARTKKDYMVEKDTQIDELKPRGDPDFMTWTQDWYNLRRGRLQEKEGKFMNIKSDTRVYVDYGYQREKQGGGENKLGVWS